MEPSSSIDFFFEDVAFSLPEPANTKEWIERIVEKEGAILHHINYIFCTDHYLLEINKKYLQHDFLTDIITFDLSEGNDLLEADIYISVERVKENAGIEGVDFIVELHRVIIHGILHLLGFKDKSATEKKAMHEKEDSCLSLYRF